MANLFIDFPHIRGLHMSGSNNIDILRGSGAVSDAYQVKAKKVFFFLTNVHKNISLYLLFYCYKSFFKLKKGA